MLRDPPLIVFSFCTLKQQRWATSLRRLELPRIGPGNGVRRLLHFEDTLSCVQGKGKGHITGTGALDSLSCGFAWRTQLERCRCLYYTLLI